jgi:hypothetical protein
MIYIWIKRGWNEKISKFFGGNFFMHKYCKSYWILGAFISCMSITFAMEVNKDLNSKHSTGNLRKISLCPEIPPPCIDGKINQNEWKRALHLIGFTTNKGGVPKEKTEVFLGHDAKKLYFAFVCYDSCIEKIKKDAKTNNATEIWNDDCIEIFIEPKRNSQNYYQFALTPSGIKGCIYNLNGHPKNYLNNDRWTGKINRDSKSWSAEIAIPFDTFQKQPKRGEAWGMNFCRAQPMIKNFCSWSPLIGSFKQPEKSK